jgi:Fe-S-cluster containining protein
MSDDYECSIYDVRPVLCRLYPFDFERINSNSFLLKIIPCCKGLNNADGEPVNEKFIAKHLFENILKLMISKT